MLYREIGFPPQKLEQCLRLIGIEVELRVGARYETWSVNAYVNNLTDKRGVLNGGLDANRPAFFTYIQPRTIGLSLAESY